MFFSQEVELKNDFIDEVFSLAPNHHEIFSEFQKKAELLSKIYAHKGRNGASTIDLLTYY